MMLARLLMLRDTSIDGGSYMLNRNQETQKINKSCLDSGQAMTEYIILVVLVGLVCVAVAKTLPSAVGGYVLPFYYCVSRPFP